MKSVQVLSIVLVYALTLQAQQTGPARTLAEAMYKKATTRFAQFEKAHGHFVNTKNVRMHYLTWGNQAGTPLIWLHGSFTNSYELLSIADDLVKAGYYVIAIDYYGHGQTPIPTHEVSLYHVADDLKFLIDHLGIRKVVIGGWSRGGSIASAFYDGYPGCVLGLILEDGGSVSANTYYHKMDSAELSNRVKNMYRQQVRDTTYASEFEAYLAIYDSSIIGSQFEYLAWIHKNKEGKWSVSPGLWELFNMSNGEEFLSNILRPTRVPLFAESMAILEPKIIYRNLHVPMLILDPVSKDDLFPFEAENEALKQQHPLFIDHKIYENTGHNIHYERREQFIKDVTDFLKRVKKQQRLK